MPVEALTAEYSYLGDGVTTNFPFPSRFLASEDLHVALNGAEQLSGFTVSGAGEPSGGEVIFASPPGNGVRVLILRDPVPSQLIDFENGQTVLEGTLDNALDKLTMIAQFLTRAIKRSVRITDLSYTTEGSDLIELPAAVLRVSKLFGFGVNGEVELIDRGPYEDSVQQAIDAAAAAIAAAAAAVAARDDVRTKWLGAWNIFPEAVNTGFAIVDGAGVYIYGQANPANNGVYVRSLGAWVRVGANDLNGVVTFENIFTTAGQTVVTVPGGYTPGQIEVYRNGAYQKIGPSPGTGPTDPDCDATDGTNVVFPAATLLADDWVLVRRTKQFNIANIAAADVTVAAIAGLTGANVQAALADLQSKKAPLASPAFTGTPTATDPTGGTALRVATKGYVDSQLQPGSVLVSSAVLGAPAASIDVALTGGYQEYEFSLDQYEHVTAAQGLIFRVATDGVPTFISGASTYEQAGACKESNGIVTDNSGLLTSNIFATNLAAAGSGHVAKLSLRISQGSASKRAFWQARATFIQAGTGRLTQAVVDGGLVALGALTHIRVIPNSGNIAAGARWRLNGMRN